jgi:hypothetical protein
VSSVEVKDKIMPTYTIYETEPMVNAHGKYFLRVKYRSDLWDTPWLKKCLEEIIARMHESNLQNITLVRPGKPYDVDILKRRIA